MKWNEILNILSRKHDHKCASEWFKIKKKANEVWKLWNLPISCDIISESYGKKIEKVSNILSLTTLTNRSISKKDS